MNYSFKSGFNYSFKHAYSRSFFNTKSSFAVFSSSANKIPKLATSFSNRSFMTKTLVLAQSSSTLSSMTSLCSFAGLSTQNNSESKAEQSLLLKPIETLLLLGDIYVLEDCKWTCPTSLANGHMI